jgi:hypothetical protein
MALAMAKSEDSFSGGVAERLIAPVLKTGRPKGLVSSNLTPSACNLRFSIADLVCKRAPGNRPEPTVADDRHFAIASLPTKLLQRGVEALSAGRRRGGRSPYAKCPRRRGESAVSR